MGRAGYMADPKKLNSREIMEGQVEWRKEWFRKVPGSLNIYAWSSQEIRIDPSYCPYKRRYSWEEFNKLQERQPYIQNFPIIPGPSIDDEFDEKWFVKQYKETLKLFQYVSEFTSQMLCKIMRMLITTLICFEDAKAVDRQFWRFNFGSTKLAWDFNIGLIPQQVHGLFSGVRYLQSHYLQTFEEMI